MIIYFLIHSYSKLTAVSVSVVRKLLLLIYCIPLTCQISISIPLFVSVCGDERFYCPRSLSHLTTYYLLFFFSCVYCITFTLFPSAFTVSFLLCSCSLCLLYCRSHSTLVLVVSTCYYFSETKPLS